MKTSVSIQETHAAMTELLCGGNEPHVLLAFWSSAMSSMMKLHLNGRYTRILAQYIFTGLPEDRDELLDALGRKPGNLYPRGVMGSHIDRLYTLERLYRAGHLNFDAGLTLESQQAWRERMLALIPGMACKLLSWALFMYNPLYCKLLTVDEWHCKRLGIDQHTISGKSTRKIAAYLAVERRMLNECQSLYPEYPPVMTAAMLWENIRIANGDSQGNGFQSHKELSCRWY